MAKKKSTRSRRVKKSTARKKTAKKRSSKRSHGTTARRAADPLPDIDPEEPEPADVFPLNSPGGPADGKDEDRNTGAGRPVDL